MNCVNSDDNSKYNDECQEISDNHNRNKDDCCRNKDDSNDIDDDNDESSVSTVDYKLEDIDEPKPSIPTQESTKSKIRHIKKEENLVKQTTFASSILSSSLSDGVGRKEVLNELWKSCRRVLGLQECSLFVQLKQQGKILYGGSADMVTQFKCEGIVYMEQGREVKLTPLHVQKSTLLQENKPAKPLICNICSNGRKSFSSRSSLNRHLRRVHTINTKTSKDKSVVSHLGISKEDNNSDGNNHHENIENGYPETEMDCDERLESKNDSGTLEISRKRRKSKMPLKACINEDISDTNSIDDGTNDDESEDKSLLVTPEHNNIFQNTKAEAETLNSPIQNTDLVTKSGSLKRKKKTNVDSNGKSIPKMKAKVKGAMCEECGYLAKCNSLLKRHQRIHKGENPYKTGKTYKCELCDFVADRPATVRRHSSTHTNERPFQCMTCGSTFRLSYHLTRHERTHLDPDGKLECKICNKKFTRKEHLLRHESVHSNERPFGCTVCTKRFARSDYLRDHMRYHTGDRPHQCSQCGRRYVTKKEYRKHIERCCQNSDTVPYVTCRECKRSFRSASALQRHEEKHKEEHIKVIYNNTQGVINLKNSTVHICVICDEQFSDMDQFRQHMNLHVTGPNQESLNKLIASKCTSPPLTVEPSPFMDTTTQTATADILKCGICGSMFTDSESLSSHVQSHDLYASHANDMYTAHVKEDAIASQALYTLY